MSMTLMPFSGPICALLPGGGIAAAILLGRAK
jgi:hypothetical protein